MSSEGSLCRGNYTTAAIDMAKANKDMVVGFICQEYMGDRSFLHCTPGVKMEVLYYDGKGNRMWIMFIDTLVSSFWHHHIQYIELNIWKYISYCMSENGNTEDEKDDEWLKIGTIRIKSDHDNIFSNECIE